MTAQGHNLQVIPGSQSVRLYCGGGREDWRWGLGLVSTFSLGGRVVPFEVAPGLPPWAEEKGLVGAAVSNTPPPTLAATPFLSNLEDRPPCQTASSTRARNPVLLHCINISLRLLLCLLTENWFPFRMVMQTIPF